MDSRFLYENLARHLHQGIVGAPMSPALIGILEILFSEEEAEVAGRLPFQNKSLSQLKELIPDKAGSLERILTTMAKNGTVFTIQRPGKERKYRLLPSMVGWAETPFWPGIDTERARMLAPLWLKYRDEGYGRELARNTPIVRVIPIERSLKDKSEILPFDQLKEKMNAVGFFAVGKCPCRQLMSYVGKGCDHSLENCLHFEDMARYIVEQGMGRQIDREEAIRILEEADREGLVHSCENLNGHISMVCNCCTCCCYFLQTRKLLNLNVLSSSNYVSSVDMEACKGCGTCEKRCPVNAIAVGADQKSHVDSARCIGCGVCVPACTPKAVSLVRRESITPPPDIADFLNKRYLAPGS